MNNYSWLERKLHQFALSSQFMREAMFDLERLIFSDKAQENTQDHIFIAGLARSGTTILLNAIYGSKQFASLSYDDMPFILSPNLWSKLNFTKKHLEPKERAHGDNIKISTNSPEAFEEVFWNTFSGKPEKEKLFKEYIFLILNKNKKTRYLSKNNNNIRRLVEINKIYPKAKILIPFRDPLQHANSLLFQHKKFLEDQKNDLFVLEYMGLIGHSEFGLGYKPVSFMNTEFRNEASLNHWLEQWFLVYKNILTQTLETKNFYPICYESLCSNPEYWSQLEELLKIEHCFEENFVESKKEILNSFDKGLLTKSINLYADLIKISLKKLSV